LTFNKGSLILLDYTAKIKDTGEVFETTNEEEAKKHSLHDHNVKYQPRLVSIGEGWLVKGFDEALQNTSVGDKKTIEVSAEKGFGERDSGKVRMIPLRKLGEDAEKVSIGDTIEVDNKKGTVRFIGSGRVQMDYNHRFAGKIILYDVNILKELKSDEEKIPGILKRHLPVKDEEISFNKNGQIVDITIPKEIFRVEGLHIMKHLIQSEIFKFTTIEKISFIEMHENKKSKPKEKISTDSKKELETNKKT